ncbi:signal peptidase I [Chloroflexota bacterium]
MITSRKYQQTESNFIFDTIAQDVLKQGCCIKFRAYGDSMVPTIRNGDLLTVEPNKEGDLNPGDIIFYRHSESKYSAHRLVAKKMASQGETLITRGDNQKYTDIPISSEQVLGKVVSIECRKNEHNYNSILTLICYFFNYVFLQGYIATRAFFQSGIAYALSILR